MTMESSGKGQVEAEVANALRMETCYARKALKKKNARKFLLVLSSFYYRNI